MHVQSIIEVAVCDPLVLAISYHFCVIANRLEYATGDPGISSPVGDSRVHSDGMRRESYFVT